MGAGLEEPGEGAVDPFSDLGRRRADGLRDVVDVTKGVQVPVRALEVRRAVEPEA